MKRWGTLAVIGLWVLVAAPTLAADSGPPSSPSGAVTPVGTDTLSVALNRVWILMCGFLIFAMQAGFALMETGLTRAKNVAHTMAMNLMIFCLAAVGYWAIGFALMYGNVGPLTHLGGVEVLNGEATVTLGGKPFGLFGYRGFFLAGVGLDAGVLTLFFFHLMFLDTAATIPTGAMAERWRFRSFIVFGLFVGAVLFPVYGNWVWGNGWLAHLGINFGLGHGHVDFAGSSVVHMLGGLTGLVGAKMLGPRIGKYRPNGTPNPLPAHNIPMYMLGTLLLALGWFGFNAGNVQAATDPNIARIAVNTMLAAATGALASMTYMWLSFGKPDPSFICNGTLAGLVAITGPCAYVTPGAAIFIGTVAGLLVIWSALFLEHKVRVDDPVGAVSVHATNGLWGVLALGLFADGTYAPTLNFNGVPGNVTGLLYGDPSQLVAQMIGAVASVVWVVPMASAFFWVVGRLVGNRVNLTVEMQGLDVPELGAFGYINNDPKAPEGRTVVPVSVEPRAAIVPPTDRKQYVVVVDGVDLEKLATIWSDLCQVSEQPALPDFQAVYPFMRTLQGNRFRFRGGDPNTVRGSLERLFQQQVKDRVVRTRLEM